MSEIPSTASPSMPSLHASARAPAEDELTGGQGGNSTRALSLLPGVASLRARSPVHSPQLRYAPERGSVAGQDAAIILPQLSLLTLDGINSSHDLLSGIKGYAGGGGTPDASDDGGDRVAGARSRAPAKDVPPVPPQSRRVRQLVAAALCATVFFAYAIAMFVNGIAGRLVAARPLIDVSSLSPPVALVYEQLGPMFALSLYRTLAIGLLLAYMAARRDTPSPPDPLSRRMWAPIAMGATNAGGYLFYMILCSLSGVALWSSLVGCYVVMPVGYGLLLKGERRSAAKLAGVGACLLAVLMLSLAGNSAEAANADAQSEATIDEASSSMARGALKAALFLLCICTWAASDIFASYVAKGPGALHMFTIELGSGLGFALVALCAGGLQYAIESTSSPAYYGAAAQLQAALALAQQQGGAGGLNVNATLVAPVPDDATPSLGGWVGGQAILCVAQCLGVCGQWATVKLGQSGAEASSFLPLISTYTTATALLGILVLGEHMAVVGYFGMGFAACGVVLIALSGMHGG